MTDLPVNLSRSGPPRTVIDAEGDSALQALQAAMTADDPRVEIGTVVTRWPKFLDAWAQLGAVARDDAEAYAFYRVGYHRGLDRLRQNGWRGSGYVPWEHEENRGFLRCVAGLQAVATRIGETDESERCLQFLSQLDPAWPPAEFQ